MTKITNIFNLKNLNSKDKNKEKESNYKKKIDNKIHTINQKEKHLH